MLYIRKYPFVWPGRIPAMSRGHSKTFLYPFLLLSFSYSSLSHNNWSKVVLCMCTRYTVNSITSNHHSNQLGCAWLPAIIIKLVKFLKRGKAPGPDTIHNQVLRLGTTTSLFHHLAKLFLFHPIRLHPNCMETSHPPYVTEA